MRPDDTGPDVGPRLELAAELWRLCLSLGQAKLLDAEPDKAQSDSRAAVSRHDSEPMPPDAPAGNP